MASKYTNTVYNKSVKQYTQSGIFGLKLYHLATMAESVKMQYQVQYVHRKRRSWNSGRDVFLIWTNESVPEKQEKHFLYTQRTLEPEIGPINLFSTFLPRFEFNLEKRFSLVSNNQHTWVFFN
jgi:hypothetical protein